MIAIAIQIPAFADSVRSDTYSIGYGRSNGLVEVKADELELLADAVDAHRRLAAYNAKTRGQGSSPMQRKLITLRNTSRAAYVAATGLSLSEVRIKIQNIADCF